MQTEAKYHRFVPVLIILAAAGVLISSFADIIQPVSHNPVILGRYDIDRFLYIVFYSVAILGTLALSVVFLFSPERYTSLRSYLAEHQTVMPWAVGIALLLNLVVSMIAYERDLSALFGSIQLAVLIFTISVITIVPEAFSSFYDETIGKLSNIQGGYLGLLFLISVGIIVCFFLRKLKLIDPDNLLALGMIQSDFGRLVTRNTLHFPAYRPIPYVTLWVQYRLGDDPKAMILGNGIIMILTGVMFYLIVCRETRSPIIATLTGLLLITENRILPSYYWLGERQSSLVALFGLISIYLVLYNQHRKRYIGIAVFLLLSTLSKEYGLAFHVFIIVYLLMNKPDDYLHVGIGTIAAALVFFALRGVVIRGSVLGTYCTKMGLFNSVTSVCYSDLTFGSRLAQYLYNIATSFVGSFVPELFRDNGAFQTIARIKNTGILTFLIRFITGALAIYGVTKDKKRSVPFASLIISTAVLSFTLYRPRNQMVAVVGVLLLVGIALDTLVKRFQGRYGFRTAIAVLTTLFLLHYCHTIDTTQRTFDAVSERTGCIRTIEGITSEADIAEMQEYIYEHYNMVTEVCTE